MDPSDANRFVTGVILATMLYYFLSLVGRDCCDHCRMPLSEHGVVAIQRGDTAERRFICPTN